MKRDRFKGNESRKELSHRASNVVTNAFRFVASRPVLASFLILAVTGLIYSNTLNSPLVFDDLINIQENPHIRLKAFSVDKIMAGLAHSGSRPLASFSFMLNYLFGGYNTFGYHVVNILIHAISGILFFLFVRITLRRSELDSDKTNAVVNLPISICALLAAFLWVAHPVNTQSVTYIVQRMNSLSTMFCMLSLVLYAIGNLLAGARKIGLFVLAGLSWVLALASKENAVILPVLVLLYDWYFFQNFNREWLMRHLKYALAALILIGLITLIFLGADPLEKLRSLQDFSEGKFSYSERILTQFRVIIYYLSLFIFPHPSRLNLDYDFPLSYSLLHPPTTIFSIIPIIGLLFLAIVTSRKWRIFSFGLFWFFLNLAVESSIIPIAIIFEHRTYMPFMGLALLSVMVIDRYARWDWLKITIVCGLVLIGSWWTYDRNEVWKDSFTLWQDVVAKSPQKARPHFNLGIAYADRGNDQQAMAHYETAIKIDPEYAEVYNNIGFLHFKKGLWEDAERAARTALRKKPDLAKAHNILGASLFEQGKDAEALQHYSRALKYNPDFAEVYMNMGVLYAARNKRDLALKHYNKALEIAPDLHEVHNKIGDLYSRDKDFQKAEFHFKEALKADPSDSEALTNMGMVHHKQGNTREAMTQYQKALAADPDNPDAHYNIANLYMASENSEKAERHYRMAIRLDHDHVEAHTNLGVLLNEKGEPELAMAHYQKAIALNPNYVSAHNNIGNLLSKQDRFESAIPYYREAIRLDPDFDDAHVNLGIALMRMGDIKGAERHFRLALKANPSNQGAEKGLEIIHSSEQPPAVSSPEDLHQKAIEHAARGEYDLAVELFKKILAIVPSEPGTCYNIACMYAKMGNIADAIEWLTQAIQNGYDNWDAIKHDPDLANIREADDFKALIKDH